MNDQQGLHFISRIDEHGLASILAPDDEAVFS